MKVEEFVDKGETTKEGDKLVLFYNKTLGCKSPRGGRYLNSFELIEPENYCCEPMSKNMDGLHPVFDLDSSYYNEKEPFFAIRFISEYDVECLGRDEDITVSLIPIKYCPFCQAEIILKCKDVFQLKLKKETTTSCQTYKEKVKGL